MSSVTLNYKVTALEGPQYRAWRLFVSALDAVATDGTNDDPNIFVARIDKRTDGDKDVFSHIASLYEMNNLPAGRANVPPKTAGFYRTSLMEIDFMNRPALDAAKDLISADVTLLIRAASNDEVESEETISVT